MTFTADRPSSTAEAFEEFKKKFPSYDDTSKLDELRSSEYGRLDELGHVYVDYTGAGMYAASQVKSHADFLLSSALGNPHSSNPTSMEANERVEKCRKRVLEFFNADPDEYLMVYTANASHGLKLIGESYPFESGGKFALTFDNHNSVNGIREFARSHGAAIEYVPVLPPDLRLAEDRLLETLQSADPDQDNLFAFPAQSNFSGVKHPLAWIEKAQQLGWDVMLDAAAFAPTNRLDLSLWHPEFVVLSFYKMFGYPTGVGALLAKKSALGKLRRPWFAGGTITVASVQADRYFLHAGSEAFEDGTLNYTSFPAVDIGLDFLDSIGMDVIQKRIECLVGWLLEQFESLKHDNGEPLVRIYGPQVVDARGGTVAFNVYDSSGNTVDHLTVEARANESKISLRTGCFCNPGAGEAALGLGKDEIVGCLAGPGARMTLDEFRQCIDEKSTGAVRVSLGIASNFEDVDTVIRFFKTFLNK